jgi:molecular chaperone GrpE (heat shock protein)
MKNIICLILAIGFFCAAPALSDTIYSWTDEQGVLRFSNDPPPENVKQFDRLESQPSSATPSDSDTQRRSSYDQMVRHSKQEARQIEQQRRQEARDKAEAMRRQAEARRKAETAAARRRLEEQIEAIKKRAVSPTYSQGMKQSQIDRLRKQIEQLEKNSGSAGK